MTDPSIINAYVEEYLDEELYRVIVEKSNQTSIEKIGRPLRLGIYCGLQNLCGYNFAYVMYQLPAFKNVLESQIRYCPYN